MPSTSPGDDLRLGGVGLISSVSFSWLPAAGGTQILMDIVIGAFTFVDQRLAVVSMHTSIREQLHDATFYGRPPVIGCRLRCQ